MATYKEIETWIWNRYGWKPKTCWIAHCKELAGLPRRDARNRYGRKRQVLCPPAKRGAILEAFRHFRMLRPIAGCPSPAGGTLGPERASVNASRWIPR